jgi:tetratricopeptide (TPR) repeat protein
LRAKAPKKQGVNRAVFLTFLGCLFVGTAVFAQTAPEKTLVENVLREFEQHNYKEVIQLYREFAAGKPERYLPVIVKVLYSQALADTGDINGAIDTLKNILEDLPAEVDSLKLQYDLANLLFLQKRFEEARVIYRRLVLRSEQTTEILAKAKERLDSMKDLETGARKKDIASIELIDVGTSLESGVIPDGAEVFLKRVISQHPKSPQAAEARRLQARLKDMRMEKAQSMLDEARRLFDQEKKYAEVRDLLEELQRSYADVSETTSVEALLKAVQAKLGRKTND